MSAKYNYDDIVTLIQSATVKPRIGQKCWVVGIFNKRPKGEYMKQFPEGVVYTVEFEDGCSTEVHEDDLELFSNN